MARPLSGLYDPDRRRIWVRPGAARRVCQRDFVLSGHGHDPDYCEVVSDWKVQTRRISALGNVLLPLVAGYYDRGGGASWVSGRHTAPQYLLPPDGSEDWTQRSSQLGFIRDLRSAFGGR